LLIVYLFWHFWRLSSVIIIIVIVIIIAADSDICRDYPGLDWRCWWWWPPLSLSDMSIPVCSNNHPSSLMDVHIIELPYLGRL
jgi:hypothetical protein